MKASEMIEKLTKLIEKYGDLDLVYSSDSEGNSFHQVFYEPTEGMFNGDDWTNNEEDVEDYKINSFCIN